MIPMLIGRLEERTLILYCPVGLPIVCIGVSKQDVCVLNSSVRHHRGDVARGLLVVVNLVVCYKSMYMPSF